MSPDKVAMLHYSAPPVVGGVEAVILAHADVFQRSGYPVLVIAGKGDASSLPEGVDLLTIPEMDSQHPQILAISEALQRGHVPPEFSSMVDLLSKQLSDALRNIDVLIVHNVMTKHFNLPLTAAIYQLMDKAVVHRCLAWTHDITWTSPNSRSAVHAGYPWDLLRGTHARMQYVVIAAQRQSELSSLLNIPEADIPVVYNGVDPCLWLGLSGEGWQLINRMGLLSNNLLILMPVRVTQAKNIELAAYVLAALRDMGCEARLVVTGPPDPHNPDSLVYYRSLLDLRSSLGLDQAISFVYEWGEKGGEPNMVSQQVVSDLMRVSDVLFMPSHREGFGIPVIEAGLIGLPVVASENVPAALEIGGQNVTRFVPEVAPEEIARIILKEISESRTHQLRRQVRQNHTWDQTFRKWIEPLLSGKGNFSQWKL
jgi:glycosyltransferase involved in cell wall biosynthesis